jgi:hypothetical protein
MPRSISVTRRRPNLIDLNIRRRAGVIGFEFGVADNFDAAFAPFQLVPNTGMQILDTSNPPRSVNVPVPGSQHRDLVRFVFDPDVYTATVPALVDNTPFFVRVRPQLADGTYGPYEAMHMVLPYNPSPHRAVHLYGVVAQAADLAHSLEIQLPMQCNDIEISNDGNANLWISFDGNTGAEFLISPVTAIFKSMEQFITSPYQMFVRGDAGATNLNAILTLKNNPIGL